MVAILVLWETVVPVMLRKIFSIQAKGDFGRKLQQSSKRHKLPERLQRGEPPCNLCHLSGPI
jgi:hypothetical protein